MLPASFPWPHNRDFEIVSFALHAAPLCPLLPPRLLPGLQVLGLFVEYMLEVVGLPSPLAILATVPFAGTRPDLS